VMPFLSREASVQALAGSAKRINQGCPPQIGAGTGSG
jgi:hypothetical protein